MMMFGVLAPRRAESGDKERRRTGPPMPTNCYVSQPSQRPHGGWSSDVDRNGWKSKKKKKKTKFFCHTMKLYNVNIYKEITFICGYYGENDLVNKVLVMFAHFWLCSHCSRTTRPPPRLWLVLSLHPVCPAAITTSPTPTNRTSHGSYLGQISLSFLSLHVGW